MKVEIYIQDLLYRYDCVVVPNFGAFLTHRKSAKISSENNSFYPPKKVVSFNRQLTENDGILINYIATAEAISYQKAMLKVNKFVKQLLHSLHHNQNVSFEKIGKFSLEGEKILFAPEGSQNYLLDSFGLSSFTAEPQEIAAPPKVVPIEDAKETPETTEEKAVRTKPNYWRYAAVGVVAIGLAGLLSVNWYSNEVKDHNLVQQQKAAQEVEKKIQQATFNIRNPLPEITFKADAPATGKYHIVAGAFREKENANKKLRQLKEAGFKAKAIGTNKYNLHQIIYSSYTNRLESLKALRQIKATHNSQAWLLVKEL